MEKAITIVPRMTAGQAKSSTKPFELQIIWDPFSGSTAPPYTRI